ncbi:hypothetical protein INS49_010592 [Diaporthe citri]|uniref:uncharacterized protein n=1 Tax=Diaporthe citri TaxID=83186 RepID=UPI001C7EA1D3|nr:uncharacterized protein INS49_010592 [Diaporthe citri]KAG6362362.1 hypothetical protein INS49_010592 [Diaporthe citri]
MARLLSLKPSCLHVKLPPVKWIHFTMHESQFLDMSEYQHAWSYTWKAILLASGVPHDGSTEPARFLLSKHDDHALAVLLRTTIAAKNIGKLDILSKEEAARFSVRGKPLEVIECELSKHEDIEHEVETETED